MLTLLSPADAQSLRDFLQAACYTDLEFRKRPGLRELPARHSGNWPYLLDYTREPTVLNFLLRLFLFGIPLDRKLVSGIVPPGILSILLNSGLLHLEADQLQASVMLTPLDNHWFVADPLDRIKSAEANDFVLWANPTTRILNQVSIRRHMKSILDLGAGCGVLSVLAAANGDRIVATDLNPRAESFTHFNASLNSITNIETYTGDTFEPIKDQCFDLILANPPFFVTPSSDQMYCENSMDLDQYCRRVVREGATHLNDGGYLQMTFEWVQVQGQSWQDRVAEWLDGAGCDAWILRGYTRDPAAYAYERIKEEFSINPERATKKFTDWLEHYRRSNVEQICGGLLSMRKRTGDNWLRIEELPLEISEPIGESVLSLFSTQTFLSTNPADEELLKMKPRLASGTKLQQSFALTDHTWLPDGLNLTLSGGLPGTISVEFPVAEFLASCSGESTLHELIVAVAAKVNAPVELVRQQCCSVVRKLAERRFLAL